MSGSANGAFDDPYFLTYSMKHRIDIINSYDFKFYHFLYSVNREEYLYDGLGSSIDFLQRT